MKLIAALALILILGPAKAQDKPGGTFWGDPAVRACCSEADALYSEVWVVNSDGSITATVTGGGPRDHAWAPIGREYTIPPDRVISVPGNPTGRAILFVRPSSLEGLCFAMGSLI